MKRLRRMRYLVGEWISDRWWTPRTIAIALLTRYGKRRFHTTVCRGSVFGRHRWQSVHLEIRSDDRFGVIYADQARASVVCLRCREHTYAVTRWAGYYLGDPLRPEETA